MKIDKLKQSVNKVQTIRGETAKLSRELLEEFQDKRSVISYDRDLSHTGKTKKINELQTFYEKKVLKLALKLQNQEKEVLTNARNEAERILTEKLPSVDKQKRELFVQNVDELKGKALFATSVDTATKALQEIVDTADEPALAYEVKSDVMEISKHLLEHGNSSDGKSLRLTLSQIYQEVNEAALPDGTNEAREAIEFINQLSHTPMFSGLEKRAFKEISPLANHYINNAESYFKKYSEE
ncbi:hypothetical protein [Thalassobacillus pellis]|uniref:hypothetical protein n=1 Tax=Thalassobacillus pellis TaxID=748008 RepID=UPI001960AD7B|nr:hypothetical protein [Thalassobacillus pellis]MBM7554902.1 hypothetical protein [Thalassobacillus pellis]